MKNYLLFHKLATAISTSSLILLLGASATKAATQDTTQSQQIQQIVTQTILESQVQPRQQTAQTVRQVRNTVSNRSSGINNAISGIFNQLFGSLFGLIQSVLGIQHSPDLGEAVQQIMQGNLPDDYQTSSRIENNIPNSYAIRQDAANAAQRVGALKVAQDQTLSQAAQIRAKETLDISAAETASSSQMANDSQSSDTSQHILQNISQQLKNQATINDLQMREAVQARQDRALQLTIMAQAASELNEANIKSRQAIVNANNSAAGASALLVMPGGAVLGQQEQSSN